MENRMGNKNKSPYMRGPTLSLCMIVKDEESCLARCLESVKGLVDEMIVVDTGSTDKTVEVAKSYGAKVYRHPWENDFSKHRNQSLSYATGEWIFQLDADEALFMEDRDLLRDTIKAGEADYYHLRFYDMKKDGSIHGTFYLIRLFRNGMGMCYERKVHNQLCPQGRGAYSAIRIRHYGYDLSPEKMEAKHIRTTTLLKQMLAANPEDAYSIYQLSSSYSLHHEYDKAVAYGEEALAVMHRKQLRNSYFLTVFHTVSHGYYALGRTSDAERTCLEALDFFPMHPDMCHLLADIYFRGRSFDQYKAIAARYLSIYEAIEKDPAIVGGFFCHSLTKRYEIYFGLACVHFLEKNFDAADGFFQKSFDDGGRRMGQAENVCRFYFEQHMNERAVQWLKLAYQAGLREGGVPAVLNESNALYLKITGCLIHEGDMLSASECLQKVRGESLSADEVLEKQVLQMVLSFQAGATDNLLVHLESLMATLALDTQRTLQSLDELGRLLYEVAEALCGRQQWALAEAVLGLAVQIAPAHFDHARFQHFL
jgi:glycosyltransferase involved in cell wall biosynthesis